jgi:hypothetical protein
VRNAWLLLHLIGMSGFLTTHAVSVYAMFEVRSYAADRDKIVEITELSRRTMKPMYLSSALLLIGGIGGGIKQSMFGQSWLLLSIVILLGLSALMSVTATPYMKKLRLGCTRWADGTFTLSDEGLTALLASKIPALVSATGTVGLLAILALMIYKPGS